MSIRNSMITCLFTASLAAGCGGLAANPAEPFADGERQIQEPVRCPDPDVDCLSSNGKDIYTITGGKLYFDPNYRFMITHFNNYTSAPYVRFTGRYYDAASLSWQSFAADKGNVHDAQHASFPGTTWQVRGMTEASNGLLVTIYSPIFGMRYISGSDLLNLTIRISVKVITQIYILSFHSVTVEPRLVRYQMRWRKDAAGTVPVSYCWDNNLVPDDTVFQGRIEVSSINGKVTDRSLTASMLTVSCRKGAMATCKSWGYDEMTNPWHFDSCIHMKRASYCGDKYAWTVPGTLIQKADDLLINSDAITNLESHWSPDGATCLDTPRVNNPAFPGDCNGVPVPACPSAPPAAPYLTSGTP